MNYPSFRFIELIEFEAGLLRAYWRGVITGAEYDRALQRFRDGRQERQNELLSAAVANGAAVWSDDDGR